MIGDMTRRTTKLAMTEIIRFKSDSLSRKANTGENICHIDKISLPKRDARIQIGLNKQKVAGSMADVTWSGEAVCDIIQSQSLF